MRWVCCIVLVVFAGGCAKMNVKRLDLNDVRLPIEARRWLADAEDEVAIAKAAVDDADGALDHLERYRDRLEGAVEKAWAKSSDGKRTAELFTTYADGRVDLKELELNAAQKALGLARARLRQARAETAARYDIAVYELQEISKLVAGARMEVSVAQKKVEDKRTQVEKSADAAWKSFAQFVGKGGVSNALWGLYQDAEQ